MELFQSQSEYTVRGADSCLSCSRSSGSMQIKAASDVDLSSAVCLGLVEGVVGKFQFHTNLECFLILVQQKGLVGTVPGKHKMYKITKVAVIPLTDAEPQNLKLEFCKTHQRFPSDSAEAPFQKKFPRDSSSKRQFSNEEKLERRLLEELVKMFTDSNSFYYSLTYDITNTAQRQQHGMKGQLRSPSRARIDDRFFWNKYMIRDLLEGKNAMSDQWIIPIIQGFVQVQEIHVGHAVETDLSNCPVDEQLLNSSESKFLLVLISRRSRHRGGMRYKRRGIDSDGNVANYVETEQLIYSGNDILSFVQIRGSVPVFWSQEGYRYKPRPKLHRSEEENKQAFLAHFREQLKIYNKEVIINLVNQTGTEKLIGDAYLRHFKMLNDPHLIYVAFDFHQQCQGRKFENVEILMKGISYIIDDLKWFRLTKGRVVKKQEGVPRVNCMDSLDRTNLVQTVIARNILEQQLKVLKILPQQSSLPYSIQRIFQIMWANNGDAISRQYAGTAAMKSDFTRTGERKFSGMMKNGYRSANRYYLSHFRHAYRQAVIDLMNGVQMTKDLHTLIGKQKPAKALLIKEQRRRQKQEIEALILACSSLLIPTAEKCLGGWLFIDCNPRSRGSAEEDLDVMFLVSSKACYFAHINKESEVSYSRRISLSEVERIEIGLQPVTKEKSKKICMKIHYTCSGRSNNQYTLRPALQYPQGSSRESLRAIAEIVQKAKCEATGADLPIRAENRRCNRFMEGVWTLLLSFVHFLLAMVKSSIKSCQQYMLRNRKVDMSRTDLAEASPELTESCPVVVTPEQGKGSPCINQPCQLDALRQSDQEMFQDRVFSIYLPKDGKATLQVSHCRSIEGGASGSCWQYLASSRSGIAEEEDELISVKSSPSTSSYSSWSSDQDSSVDGFTSPDAGQLRDSRRRPGCHSLLPSGFASRLGLPSLKDPAGCHPWKHKTNNNPQLQGASPPPPERRVPDHRHASNALPAHGLSQTVRCQISQERSQAAPAALPGVISTHSPLATESSRCRGSGVTRNLPAATWDK